MRLAFFIAVAAGLAIGFLWPRADTAAVPIAAPLTASDPEAREEPRPTVIERSDLGHFYTHAEVNGTMVRFVVDTGASHIALTVDDAKRIGIAVDPKTFQWVGSGASGDVIGQVVKLKSVSLDGKRVYDLPATVLPQLTISLLGQSYLRRIHNVSIAGDTMTIG